MNTSPNTENTASAPFGGFHTVEGFCATFGVKKSFTYELLAKGELDGRKVGKKTLITKESAQRWAASLPVYRTGSAVGKAPNPATAA